MAYLRRKVDQQLGFCDDLLQMKVEPSARDALRSAVCWQLEQTLCFYLLEVALASGNRRWSHGWTLDAGLLAVALKNVPSADVQELVDLGQEHNSWLADLLSGLQSLRRVEASALLKGELFQTDLMESKPQLIVTSDTAFPVIPEWENLVRIKEALRSTIQRQRLGHEEY